MRRPPRQPRPFCPADYDDSWWCSSSESPNPSWPSHPALLSRPIHVTPSPSHSAPSPGGYPLYRLAIGHPSPPPPAVGWHAVTRPSRGSAWSGTLWFPCSPDASRRESMPHSLRREHATLVAEIACHT